LQTDTDHLIIFESLATELMWEEHTLETVNSVHEKAPIFRLTFKF